jgi:hypothetical protein
VAYLNAQEDVPVSELSKNISNGCLQLPTRLGEDEFKLQDFTQIQSKPFNLLL